MKHKAIQRSHRQQRKSQLRHKRVSNKNTAKVSSKSDSRPYINGFGIVSSKAERHHILHIMGQRFMFYIKKLVEAGIIIFIIWSFLWTLCQSYQSVLTLVSEGRISKGTYLLQLGVMLIFALILAAISGSAFSWIISFNWSFHRAKEQKREEQIKDCDINRKFREYIKKGYIHVEHHHQKSAH